MIEIQAPAKINLNLRILGKRENGFHDLETLMTPVALHDTLTISKQQSGTRFTCSREDLETDDNLVIRAIRLLERETKSPLPLHVHLEKRTPSGAGLGGGSSDAAAAFKAVRELYELGISDQRLEELSAELGSDIPFFIAGKTAWCRGRGEILEPIDFPWRLDLLLLRHPLEIPTPWAYRHWANSKEIPGLPYAAQNMPWGTITNDLERPAFAKFLIIGETKRWLLEQPEVQAAAMTGSGSALFALLKERTDRKGLIDRARERYGDSLWVA
ncbi:MAG: 4-diphosphocytidyl-2-C-methyl-D-erythritol kinase [Verrucomicrobiales bacterium]|jgi:4-diphosphocytidyl-2-C-methyl-D-erythritol kinase